MTAQAVISDVAGKLPSVTARFNPASLKLSISNKLQDENSGAGGATKETKPRQSTQATTTKLDTELVFDTTDTGQDVRTGAAGTGLLKALALTPGTDQPKPPMVKFAWGNFSFQGVIESLNETLDFWSDEGVPLRSAIQLTIQGSKVDAQVAQTSAKLTPPGSGQTLATVPSGSTGTTGLGSRLGNAGAGRAIAALNGIEDMRMAAGGSVGVSAGVELQAAASFSISAGAGVGVSAGAGASAGFGIGASASVGAGGAGIGASASAGFGAGASIGAGASAGAGIGFGASASVGLSASAGAFAGLGASKTTATVSLDPARLLPPPRVVVTTTSPQFDATGRMINGGSGFDARLGATASAGVAIG